MEQRWPQAHESAWTPIGAGRITCEFSQSVGPEPMKFREKHSSALSKQAQHAENSNVDFDVFTNPQIPVKRRFNLKSSHLPPDPGSRLPDCCARGTDRGIRTRDL